MARLRTISCWILLALAFGACAKSESISGGGGTAGSATGGAAGNASGGAAGKGSGGAAGNASGGAAGNATGGTGGGAAGSGGAGGSDASADAPPDVPADAGPDGIVTLPGLQGFWRFEESVGPVFDVSGNGLNGAVVGSGVARGQPGKVGNGIGFGGADQKVTIPTSTKLDFPTAATIELWVKLSSTTQGTILSRGTGQNDDHVRITTTQGNVSVSFGRAGQSPSQVITPTFALSDQQWTHLAVVNDGQIRIYINGNLKTQGSGGGLGGVTAPLYFGKSAATDVSINGSLDEIMWFDTARTDHDVCIDSGGTWNLNADGGGTCA